MSNTMNIPPNLEGLATLLVLQDQLKNLSTIKEFGYFVTNETHRLLHYNTAYLWKRGELYKIHLLDQSEIAEIDLQSPVSQWVSELIEDILKLDNSNKICAYDFTNKNKDIDNSSSNSLSSIDEYILENWPEVLPHHILWDPFLDEANHISGGLILFRSVAFSEQEVKMFEWLGKNYQYTWMVLTQSKLSSFYKWYRGKPYLKVLGFIFLILMLIPIRLSVTANAIVESSDPVPINSPIPGIIKEFLIKPGEAVKKGQLLMIIDKTDLSKSVAINEKKVSLTTAKLRSNSNQGYEKSENRDQIPILEAELAVDQAELDYAKSQLAKADIKSPVDGIAIFDSKEDWIGQPILAGENILKIEDQNKLQLKIFLPVPDIIDLKQGSKGNFYVYGQFSEFPVELISSNYNAKLTPNKVLAYEFIAKFINSNDIPQLGSQGTVRLYGHYVPMIYFLLRRPLQTLRQTIGF